MKEEVIRAHARTHSLRALLVLTLAALCIAWPSRAEAYPWMVRHEYSGCATCHTDPSGAGILTPYGRAQSAVLLSTRYGHASEDEEPGPIKDFLFGAVQTPEWLLLQGWFRNGYLWNDVDGKLVDHRFLQMRADVGAHVAFDAFRASAIVGYQLKQSASFAQQAWVTGAADAGNLVSREHWAGLSLAEDSVLVRAGRLNLPFGLRNIEHTSWVRSETRTDTNQAQQHGAAVSYSSDSLRGEVMAIAGNFQIHPDAYRERGYAAFAELALAPRYTVGVSSLVAHSAADNGATGGFTRQAHGVFTRLAPIRQVAVLGELDMLFAAAPTSTRIGYVGFLQADVEPIQGLHAIATGEVLERTATGEATRVGMWLGVAWFAFPHVDLRVDGIRRTAADSPAALTLLAQAHLYL